MNRLHGSCHCGAINVEIDVSHDINEMEPRECDCSFCTCHGAVWVSDPNGRMGVSYDPLQLQRYRQGDQLVDFLMCKSCGVVVSVTLEHEGRRYGAVNARALPANSGLASAQPVSPARLSAPEKLARWQHAWFSEVTLCAGR